MHRFNARDCGKSIIKSLKRGGNFLVLSTRFRRIVDCWGRRRGITDAKLGVLERKGAGVMDGEKRGRS